MAGRFLSTSFLASMAVAVLAHVGVITGFLLLAPAGGLSGQLAEQADIMITLVELAEPEPQPDMAENTQAVPEPPKQDLVPLPEPSPVAETMEEAAEPETEPETLPVPQPEIVSQASIAAVEPTTFPAVEAALQPLPVETSSLPGDTAEITVPEPTPAAPSPMASSAGEGEVDMTAYWQAVQQKLARYAPSGVRGARDCEVEFRLSRHGEVVFVGIRTSSGTPLYDRRCLRAVTNAAPFPDAPPGAEAADLSFAIVMLQRR